MEKAGNKPLASLTERLTLYMQQNAMRKTPERYEVLRVAGLIGGIFTIEKLGQFMLEHGEFQVSRATLFNTMELFCAAGIAIRHPLATAAHYELRTDTAPKAYTICLGCGAMQRVPAGTARLPLQSLRIRYFSIDDRLLYLHGLCRKCQAKNRKKK